MTEGKGEEWNEEWHLAPGKAYVVRIHEASSIKFAIDPNFGRIQISYFSFPIECLFPFPARTTPIIRML